ncbi:Bardet-Biedl syndrome 5 protein [Pelagophyceae sp. CCMP2097]|nr:Bardet-Biedl syndrome 5 protein [Pelagophyceae sp. CCMP2097]
MLAGGKKTDKKSTVKGSDTAVWQDREIRFDTPTAHLANRKGESVIDEINSVEDTKGNNGERGSLVVTNLRILWISHKSSRTNLSIGFNTVVSINIRKAKSKLRGATQALYIMTKFTSSRFEFIFTSLVLDSPRLFTTVQAVLRAYETTKLYRDLKLRGSIVRDGTLVLLPEETIYSQLKGVWNLSSDQGNLGTFFITNVRVVWHANLAQNFNVSIPYMQMQDVRVRSSKFGPALVVETSTASGGYILGFRIDPAEKLASTLQEISALHAVYAVNPVFGVSFTREEKPEDLENVLQKHIEDDVDVVDDGMHGGSSTHDAAVAAYLAEPGKREDRGAVYDDHIGLAVESMPAGVSTKSLWEIPF